MLGAVVDATPPAGPTVGPPGVTCAKAGPADTAAASNTAEKRRVMLPIIISESRSRTRSPCLPQIDRIKLK